MSYLLDVVGFEILNYFVIRCFIAARGCGGEGFPVRGVPEVGSCFEGYAAVFGFVDLQDLLPYFVFGLGTTGDALSVDVQYFFLKSIRPT